MDIMYYDDIDNNRCICGFFYLVIFEDHDNWKELLDSNLVTHGMTFDEDDYIDMLQVGEWCDNNLKAGWAVSTNTAGFYLKEDAMAFKLRWT